MWKPLHCNAKVNSAYGHNLLAKKLRKSVLVARSFQEIMRFLPIVNMVLRGLKVYRPKSYWGCIAE